MTILYIIIVLLVTIILFLSLTLYFFTRKTIYLSNKEKEFIFFTFQIFSEYGEDLGIQSKEQHKQLVEELDKIKVILNK